MSLFQSFLQAVRSWRRRRGGGPRTPKRAGVNIECLDHRQLLSVNFTGNVFNDFPASQSPGVVVIPNNPSVVHPVIPPIPLNVPAGHPPETLDQLVKVSGLDINGIRLSYDSTSDTLSIGLQQPDNQKSGQPVIAGDTDNNLNSATLDPLITATFSSLAFSEPPDMGGSKTMGAFLDLGGNTPNIVAGIAPEMPGYTKSYTVADVNVNASPPGSIPVFGTPLPQYTGNYYLVNDPAHGAFEFNINHFSQLYQQVTGQALTPNTTFGVGAFGNSNQDDGISEALFPAQTVTLSQMTVPTPPPPPPPHVCPPVSPMVLINPHSHRHINTAHPDDIRVNVFGTSGFQVNQIENNTVTLGGAHPIFSFIRNINRDEFPDETFVFRGTDVNLPPGITNATISGQLSNGGTFESSTQVFNRNYSYYSPAAIAQQAVRLGEASSAASALGGAGAASSLLGTAPTAASLTGANLSTSSLLGGASATTGAQAATMTTTSATAAADPPPVTTRGADLAIRRADLTTQGSIRRDLPRFTGAASTAATDARTVGTLRRDLPRFTGASSTGTGGGTATTLPRFSTTLRGAGATATLGSSA